VKNFKIAKHTDDYHKIPKI